ncbi:uncharacterized protein si:zfos-1056e6.1 isoform X1 [Onychostoma macrolepis]|uniref:uncharacterized protein si:zfos-1056e6.1 isoform X1 n=2 Tax=Onychostoma macrolepis TaxID=369639 RepID=UPI00272AB157|nr:uncharacterized protein si:zfos-1056e6.1 isoform X1 [Onychostoma macrolepis]
MKIHFYIVVRFLSSHCWLMLAQAPPGFWTERCMRILRWLFLTLKTFVLQFGLPSRGLISMILAHSFRLDTSQTILKIRNNRGCLIPLNSCMPPNSKQMPYVLEVAKNYQHVNPRPRSIPMTVINKTLKSRLLSIVKRIERLEELFPQIKLKHRERLTKDIELLNQKLVFLHKRMQMAESYCWEGTLRRAPLW